MAISPCVNWSGAVLHELSSLSPLLRDESPPTAIKRGSFSRSSSHPITESTVNLQQRQSHCVFPRLGSVRARAPRWLWWSQKQKQQPGWWGGKNKKGNFRTDMLEKREQNRISLNREKAKANFIYFLQRQIRKIRQCQGSLWGVDSLHSILKRLHFFTSLPELTCTSRIALRVFILITLL